MDFKQNYGLKSFLMESRWSPDGVQVDLWSPCGVHMESVGECKVQIDIMIGMSKQVASLMGI